MKTILYNNAIGKIISPIFEDGYKVDGKSQPVLPPIYELQYIELEKPAITEKQIATTGWVPDIVLKTFRQYWSIRDKTQAELIADSEAKRVQTDLAMDISQIKNVLKITVEKLPETDQKNYPSIYPGYQVGKSYSAGEKFQYNGLLFKVIQSHVSQLDWEPDKVPALYFNVAFPDTIRDWKQPTGVHDAYMTGDTIRFSGSIYRSLIDYNVWSPADYPAGWELQ